jgi:hypothetical protein
MGLVMLVNACSATATDTTDTVAEEGAGVESVTIAVLGALTQPSLFDLTHRFRGLDGHELRTALLSSSETAAEAPVVCHVPMFGVSYEAVAIGIWERNRVLVLFTVVEDSEYWGIARVATPCELEWAMVTSVEVG